MLSPPEFTRRIVIGLDVTSPFLSKRKVPRMPLSTRAATRLLRTDGRVPLECAIDAARGLCENVSVFRAFLSGRTSTGRLVWLSAAVVAVVVAGVIAAKQWGGAQPPKASAAQRLWPPVPDVRGFSVAAAIDRVEAAGWRPIGRGSPSEHGKYVLRGWSEQSQRGFVRPQWGRVACGSLLTNEYRLDVGIAKRSRDCDDSRASVPPFIAFRRARGWVAVWGEFATFELWSPGVGFRTLWGDLGGGTCERRARSRAYHLFVGPDFDALRRSTWHLLDTVRRSGLCVTHHGSRDFVANDDRVRDDTVRLRVSAKRVEVDFLHQGQAKFDAEVVPARGGRATAVTVRGPTIQGSSDIGAHVRPGTCRRVSGPEYSFVVSSGGVDGELAEGGVTVPLGFATFLARHYVVELHGAAYTGADIEACARISP